MTARHRLAADEGTNCVDVLDGCDGTQGGW